MTTTGILLFDDVEELDFAGPWEVLAAAAQGGDRVVTVAENPGVIRCHKGLRVIADHSFAGCPALDVVIVPGGQGTRREVENQVALEWIERQAAGARWITSVCTGALLLWAAGPAKGRRVTTHWAFIDELRRRAGDELVVVDDARYVMDGPVVTAAGVSAGIDMALWLTGQIYGEDHAQLVQKMIEYFPDPPFSTMDQAVPS
jgi:transcriptional regulator GlxA family with amidase domain